MNVKALEMIKKISENKSVDVFTTGNTFKDVYIKIISNGVVECQRKSVYGEVLGTIFIDVESITAVNTF